MKKPKTKGHGGAGKDKSRDNSGNRVYNDITFVDPSGLVVRSSKVTQTLLHGYHVSNYERKLKKYK